MDTTSEFHDRISLIDRVKQRYSHLAGGSMTAHLESQLDDLTFGEMLELVIEIESTGESRLPHGGATALIEAAIARAGAKLD